MSELSQVSPPGEAITTVVPPGLPPITPLLPVEQAAKPVISMTIQDWIVLLMVALFTVAFLLFVRYIA